MSTSASRYDLGSQHVFIDPAKADALPAPVINVNKQSHGTPTAPGPSLYANELSVFLHRGDDWRLTSKQREVSNS